MGEIAAAVAGNYLGSKLASSMGGDQSGYNPGPNIPQIVNTSNNILNGALGNALNYSSNYTTQAVQAQQGYNTQSVNALNQSLQGATQGAQQNINQGLLSSMATNAPVVQTGYNALDSYEDSLGMARPSMGNAAYASDLQSASQLPALNNQLQQAASQYGVSNPYAAQTVPTAPGAAPQVALNTQAAQQSLAQYVAAQQQALGVKGAYGRSGNPNDLSSGNIVLGNVGGAYMPGVTTNNMNDPAVIQAVAQFQQQQQQAAAMQQYQQQQQQYGQNMANYNGFNQATSQIQNQLNQINPQALQVAMGAQQGSFGTPTRI